MTEIRNAVDQAMSITPLAPSIALRTRQVGVSTTSPYPRLTNVTVAKYSASSSERSGRTDRPCERASHEEAGEETARPQKPCRR